MRHNKYNVGAQVGYADAANIGSYKGIVIAESDKDHPNCVTVRWATGTFVATQVDSAEWPPNLRLLENQS